MRCSGLEEEYNSFIQSMENNDNPRGKKSWQAMKFKKRQKTRKSEQMAEAKRLRDSPFPAF